MATGVLQCAIKLNSATQTLRSPDLFMSTHLGMTFLYVEQHLKLMVQRHARSAQRSAMCVVAVYVTHRHRASHPTWEPHRQLAADWSGR